MAVDVVVTKLEGFGYGGRFVFNGEILPLMGLPNDGKLLSVLGYFTRYSDSPHDRSDEVAVHGRRFLTQYHSHAYLRSLAEAEERARATHDFVRTDPRQVETVALEARGITMHENRDPNRGVVVRGVDLPKTQSCPIDGCDVMLAVDDVRDHVEGHTADIMAASDPVARRPRAKRTVQEVAEPEPTRTRRRRASAVSGK